MRLKDAGARRHDPRRADSREAPPPPPRSSVSSTARRWSWIDPATKKVTGKADIKGATNVVGIDVRPADGMLYAVSADGGIYTVDAKSGQATMKSKLSETLKAGVTVTVDFNPAGGPPARDHLRRHQPAHQCR